MHGCVTCRVITGSPACAGDDRDGRVEFCRPPCLYAGQNREDALPWLDANGISIHYELAGNGPSLVLLHEMGGTLDSWDGIFPAMSAALPHAALRPARLRLSPRRCASRSASRRWSTTSRRCSTAPALPPPYHFVTVAAATMQALIYMSRHPDQHRELRVLQSVHRRRPEPHRRARRARRPRRARGHARGHSGHARQVVAAGDRRPRRLRDLSRRAISRTIRSASAPSTGRSRAAT